MLKEKKQIFYTKQFYLQKELKEGRKSIAAIRKKSVEMLYSCKFISKVEYFNIRDAESLKALKKIEYNKKKKDKDRILIAVAAWFDKTRLIDNKVVVL